MSPLLRRGTSRDAREPRPVRIPPLLAAAMRDGSVPLRVTGAGQVAQTGDRDPMKVAIVIPQFRRGSGGHRTIADLVRGLEALGHAITLWLVDEENRHREQADEELGPLFVRFFGPVRAPLRRLSIDDGEGTAAGPGEVDVVVATGWQTVPAVMRLPGALRRAYLVQDHEPDFYPVSVERQWAEWTYRQGLHCICASPWLGDLVQRAYGASVSSFDLGVDHDHYLPLPTHRRDDLVLLYARAVTPRRGLGLAVLALDELHRRRPDVEIALFGDARPVETPFPHRHLGVLTAERLAHAYASATVGLVLSMTNPSLVPTEMLACALPVVDLATPAMTMTFGADGPILLAHPDPTSLADALDNLIDDLPARAARSRSGLAYASARSWGAAARQVERGLT